MVATSASSSWYFGAEASYKNEINLGVWSGKFGFSMGLALSGSHSSASETDSSMSKEGRNSKISTSAQASLFSYTLKDAETLPYSAEFMTAVNSVKDNSTAFDFI